MIEQPITLYFDLSPEAKPTMGAVGRAMLEFEKMAGETVFLLEPSLEFSLVYDTSREGSLRIIAGLRGLISRERLQILATILATTLINNAVGHFQGKAMDEVAKLISEEGTTLTGQDIKRIAEAVAKIERSESIRAPRRELYRAVEQDQAIEGLSAFPSDKEMRPKVIVPREEFRERATVYSAIETENNLEPRVVPERMEVVLVQPPLIESSRQWRLFANGREFGAKMLDERFKQQILDGTTELRLAGGVILDVTLETKQVKEGELWHNKSFAVSEVHGWRQNPQQAELLLSHRSDSDDEN
ncbi:hypothetical protein [Phaeobacter gallaeciensis]|uniref:hypothetical protein n=1 Tax=Phaeobacter gallaeciensis TaxID=60890 RepID=UPI000BBC0A39|nr:hypothetical protein [Phaeobacter gallaeciensis]ATF17128.1 hypothetical protein PhaeoP129_00467 [Phaeobacter gallaeciensis]ATF21237.1 hypothetical protein PhaeoP128_00467 [Phaeobacter gallaeciensis]